MEEFEAVDEEIGESVEFLIGGVLLSSMYLSAISCQTK